MVTGRPVCPLALQQELIFSVSVGNKVAAIRDGVAAPGLTSRFGSVCVCVVRVSCLDHRDSPECVSAIQEWPRNVSVTVNLGCDSVHLECDCENFVFDVVHVQANGMSKTLGQSI